MNIKEIGEIKRHVRRDRSNMTAIYGCFVNDKKEIISTFCQSLATMPENEAEQFFGIFKKCLSGKLGKNLIDLPFSTEQVANGAEHALLMRLRESSLKDESVLNGFYQKLVQSLDIESSYLILLGCDSYDVPLKHTDGTDASDNSDETFRYLLCSICPVKLSKPAIEYKASEREFHNSAITQILTAPALGFLFPAFDNRSTNIYGTLFFTKDASQRYDTFIENVFAAKPYTPAAEQKTTFADLLTDALGEECTVDVIQSVHQQVELSRDLHKEAKREELLTADKDAIVRMLNEAGVSDESIARFSAGFEGAFSETSDVPLENIMGAKYLDFILPEAKIRVNPNCAGTIETRIIGGVKYLLIRADDGIEINGIRASIPEEVN